MSNVIALLEAMGRDAALPTQGEEFVATVKAAGLEDRAEAALLAADTAALNELLMGRPTMLCSLFPADDDEKREEEQEDEESPDKDESSIHLS